MLLYVHSSIAIILMGKIELVALLNLSSLCLVMVEWLFLAVPWDCLRFVIVVFPDHTNLLFLIVNYPILDGDGSCSPSNGVYTGMDSMRQSACLVINPITVNSYSFIFNKTRVGQASVSMTALT